MREWVVLIHGLGRTRHCWWLLRRRLERAGYRTAAWTYPLRQPIEVLGQDCLSRLEAFAADPDVARIHVITHSLGGIVLRQALESAGMRAGEAAEFGMLGGKLGQVVMLAPPNHGSVWARRLGPWLGWLAPALSQLSDAPDSFVNRLGAASESRNSFSEVQFVVVAAARDGKCSLATTHLPGERAHVVVSGGHTLIMNRREVAGIVLRSLHGSIHQQALTH